MAENSLRSLRGGRLLVASLAVVGGALIVGRLLSDLYVELLWFRSTGYSSIFVRRLLWLWGAVTLLMVARLVGVAWRFAGTGWAVTGA